jgi:hypothetical protein
VLILYALFGEVHSDEHPDITAKIARQMIVVVVRIIVSFLTRNFTSGAKSTEAGLICFYDISARQDSALQHFFVLCKKIVVDSLAAYKEAHNPV